MPRSLKYTLGIIGFLLLIVVIQTAWYEYRVWRGWNELYETAKEFGYTPQAEIVASRSCYGSTMWIPPSTECKVVVVFQTDTTLTEFQRTLSTTLSYANGSTLHSEINRNNNSKFTLTINGIEGDPTQAQSKFGAIRGYTWYKTLGEDVVTSINFFDLKNVDGNIELNGKLFKQNLVMIRHDVGTHSSLALLFNSNNFPYQPY